MQGRKHRLTPDVTSIGFKHWHEPWSQPPEDSDNRYQNDKTLTSIGVMFRQDPPQAKPENNGILSIAVEPDGALEQIEPGFVEPT